MSKAERAMKIGERILSLRTAKGYTREQLGEMAGVSAKFIYQIEVKHVGFSAETLQRLSKALEVSSDYILNGTSSCEVYDARIAEILGKFESGNLEKLDHLINIIYDLLNGK